jgi:hypothetical protein
LIVWLATALLFLPKPRASGCASSVKHKEEAYLCFRHFRI